MRRADRSGPSLNMESAWARLHRLDTVDFPMVDFGNEAIEERVHRSIRVAKKYLYNGLETAHFDEPKLDPLGAGHFGVIAANHRFILGRCELLLHAARSLAIGARI